MDDHRAAATAPDGFGGGENQATAEELDGGRGADLGSGNKRMSASEIGRAHV